MDENALVGLLDSVRGGTVAVRFHKPMQPVPVNKFSRRFDDGQDWREDLPKLLTELMHETLLTASWKSAELTIAAIRLRRAKKPTTIYFSHETSISEDTAHILAWRDGCTAGDDDDLFLSLLLASNGGLFSDDLFRSSMPTSVSSSLSDNRLAMALLSAFAAAGTKFGAEIWDDFHGENRPNANFDDDPSSLSRALIAWINRTLLSSQGTESPQSMFFDLGK